MQQPQQQQEEEEEDKTVILDRCLWRLSSVLYR